MFVCICNGFRDTELKALGETGIRCPRAAYEALGSHPKCGACLDSAKALLEECDEAVERERAVA